MTVRDVASEEWVLSMAQSDAPAGKNYYRMWSGIGPCGTWQLDEAARFQSEQAAMQSPAFTFPMTFYRPEKLAS